MQPKELRVFVLTIVAFLIGLTIVGPEDFLDKKIYYSGDEARQLFATYSQADIQAYTYMAFLDLVFIGVYTCAFFYGYRQIGKKAYLLFAVLPGLFDLIETSSIIFALFDPLKPHTFFDHLGIVTSLKWLTLLIAASIFLNKKMYVNQRT